MVADVEQALRDCPALPRGARLVWASSPRPGSHVPRNWWHPQTLVRRSWKDGTGGALWSLVQDRDLQAWEAEARPLRMARTRAAKRRDACLGAVKALAEAVEEIDKLKEALAEALKGPLGNGTDYPDWQRSVRNMTEAP